MTDTWKNVYQDEQITLRTDFKGEVGAWHRISEGWLLTNIDRQGRVMQGRGRTMAKARADLQAQRKVAA